MNLSQELKGGSQTLGVVAWKAFQEFQAAHFPELIANKQPLTQNDLLGLAKLPLPLLGKLISLQSNAISSVTGLVRPLILIPIAEFFERYGSSQALLAAEKQLQENNFPTCSLELDRWHGDFTIEQFCEVLRLFQQSLPQQMQILSPSTLAIKECFSFYHQRPPEDSAFEEFCRLTFAPFLSGLRINTIQGGTSVRVHEIFNTLGFRSVVAFDLSRHRLLSSEENSFADQLHSIGKTLYEAGRCLGWFPIFRQVLDEGQTPIHSPLGQEVIKSIAVTRLAFPDMKFIRAPLAMLGYNATDIALRFGANDLGFVAVDQRTAERLELPLLSRVEEIFSTSPVELFFDEDAQNTVRKT